MTIETGEVEEVEETTEEVEETPTDEATEEETAQEAEQRRYDYVNKIEALDARLVELKTEKTTDIRRKAMKDAKYSPDQIDRYVKFIDGETVEAAKQSVMYLGIPPANISYIDPTPMGGGDGKPRRKDKTEIGRSAISKVLHKIRL